MNAARLQDDRCGTRQCGLATVEFAIVVPLLLLLTLAIAEIGRALVQYATLANSVRNGVRYVAGEAYVGSTGVVSVTTTLQTQGKNLVAYGTVAAGTPVLPGLTPARVTVVNAGGGNIVVTANYPYVPIIGAQIPSFGMGTGPISLTFNLTASATMQALP